MSEALVTMEAILLNSASKSRNEELLGCTDHVHILPSILREQEDSQPGFGYNWSAKSRTGPTAKEVVWRVLCQQ